MPGSFKNDRDTILSLIHRAGPGHLAEVATCLLGVALAERARRRATQNSDSPNEDELIGSDEDADAALALAVFDSPEPEEELLVPKDKRGLVEQLRALKRIESVGGSLGLAFHDAMADIRTQER